MTEDFQRFTALLTASDQLIEQATKEDLAEVSRVLALHVAHYRTQFGDIPIEDSLDLLGVEKLTDEMARVLADGLEVLIEVLKALATPEGPH